MAGWEAVRPLWWKLSDALLARDEPTALPLLSTVDLLPAAEDAPLVVATAPEEDAFNWQYRQRPVGGDSRRQPNLVARLRKRRMAPQGQVRGRCIPHPVASRDVRVVCVVHVPPSPRGSDASYVHAEPPPSALGLPRLSACAAAYGVSDVSRLRRASLEPC